MKAVQALFYRFTGRRSNPFVILEGHLAKFVNHELEACKLAIFFLNILRGFNIVVNP